MLEPLFQQAIREKKWFLCGYQAMVFSPKELREKHAKGELVWGPVNWSLIEPPKPVDIPAEIERLNKQNASLKRRIDEGFSI